MPSLRRPTAVFDIDSVLHATLQVMEDRGGEFISGKKAQETGQTSTAKFVIQKIQNNPDGTKIFIPKWAEKAEEIKNHFRLTVNTEGDEFISRVKEILATGIVTERMIGFIVALPSLYERKVSRVTELTKVADKYATSNYIGEIGTREEFFVKLLSVKSGIIKDGVDITVYKVADQLGNYGYFFAKTGTLNDEDGLPIVKPFDCFLMKATPKKHEIGKSGVRETQFSRVRILQNVGEGSSE
jgi:hypothetical protein